MRYIRIFIPLFLILFLSIYIWSISSNHAKDLHGIILISLDTLRADHLGIYGYHRNTSPSLDAFAKENILFERAAVQSHWTIPSHMSIMTSLYPSSHGVMNEGSGLAEEHVTLAELLREGGYQTAAFTGGGYLSAAWFNHGFDSYSDQGGGIATIFTRVKKWLDKNKSKPFFLFIHCWDIHNPYNPPPPYNTIFHDSIDERYLTPHTKNLVAARKGKLKISDKDRKHFIALYDGGIRYTDEKIGEIISLLKKANKFEDSLIIMTSDHSWRDDPIHDKNICIWANKEMSHIPLFIKMPYQKHSIEIDSRFNTVKLGNFINKYLTGDFTLAETKSLLSKKDYFTPTPLESKTEENILFSEEIDIKTACKIKGKR